MKENEIIQTNIRIKLDEIGTDYLGKIRQILGIIISNPCTSFNMAYNKQPLLNDYCRKKKYLDSCTREYLLNEALIYILNVYGYNAQRPQKITPSYMGWDYKGWSDESYERHFYYQIRFSHHSYKKPIAIKYTAENLENNLIKYSKVFLLDWNENAPYDSLLLNKRKNVYEITAKAFFKEFLLDTSHTLFNVFIQKINEYLEKANSFLNFDAIQIFSPDYLHNFKKSIAVTLSAWNLQTGIYYYPEKDKETGKNSIIPLELTSKINKTKNNLEAIIQNCFENKLYMSLVGLNSFAQCFITSEYLYSLFKKRQYCFEFTPIACGYIKCIEQLLHYCIINILLETNKYQDYIITALDKKVLPDELELEIETWQKDKKGRYRKGRYRKVPFQKKYKGKFDLSIGPMKVFLEQSKANGFWSVPSAKDSICDLIGKFKDYDRNMIFHKDNILDYKRIYQIRNNTITLALLILGSLKLPVSELGIYDDSYDQLIEAILRTGENCEFDLQINDKIIRTYRPCQIGYQKVNIDDYGNYSKHTIELYRSLDTFEATQYASLTRSLNTEKIIISFNNRPEKIWYVSRNGKQLIWQKE